MRDPTGGPGSVGPPAAIGAARCPRATGPAALGFGGRRHIPRFGVNEGFFAVEPFADSTVPTLRIQWNGVIGRDIQIYHSESTGYV
jgi:hypothetical protein